MKYKHYSPRARVVIAHEASTARQVYFQALSAGVDAWLLAPDAQLEGFSGLSAASLCSREHPEEAAQRLFALLREADELGKQLVIALWNSQTGIGLSVTNRLLRASGFTILLPHGEIEAGGKIISY